MTFQPQYAIVTASDSGIGRATAVALATAGLDVGITWHSDQDGAEQTAEEVRAAGRRAEVAHLDTSDLDRCGDVIDDLADRLGGLDVLVNNAGTGTGKLTIETSLQEWRQVIATDLDGAFICMQRAAQRMVAAGQGGRIIAVTSVHEHQPRVGSAAYDAAKHGLGGLAKTMALELGQHGITVNCVAPGEIATPMTGQEDEDPHGKDRPGVPLGRPGDAREIAAVINFLASPGASYVTGASWPVDGGMLQMGPQAGSHLPDDSWRTI
jgi:NAD(P)-dependent dehydrogenase (short-subunit alcohol dehydrogenase family)